MGVSGRIVQDEEGHGVGARVALRDVTAEVENIVGPNPSVVA